MEIIFLSLSYALNMYLDMVLTVIFLYIGAALKLLEI